MCVATIEDYAKAAKFHYGKIEEHLRSALQHARQAGEALEEAYKIIGKKKWKAWLAENWPASYALSWNYRTIARDWTKLLKKFNNDLSQVSIEGALAALRVKRPPSDSKLTELETSLAFLQRKFSDVLRQWSSDDVVFLAHHSQINTLLDDCLNNLQSEVAPLSEVFNTAEARCHKLKKDAGDGLTPAAEDEIRESYKAHILNAFADNEDLTEFQRNFIYWTVFDSHEATDKPWLLQHVRPESELAEEEELVF
jgi:hypothetical protein